MAKTLKSILDKVPPATVDNPIIRKDELEEIKSQTGREDESYHRIVAVVSHSIKVQMRERIFKNPEDTERSIILKGLRAVGFDISDKELNDMRKIRRNRK